ncbi:hypothetical protein EV121DRAFT_288437 [Schizophyllum commune]
MSSSCTPSSSSPSLDRVHSECPPPRKRLRTVTPGRFLPPDEIEREKAASLARLFESWANLEERYTRDLEEDDIVDLADMTVIKDRGVLASSPVKQFGMRQALLDDGDDEGSENQDEQPGEQEEEAEEVQEPEESDDELDAFAPKPTKDLPPRRQPLTEEEIEEFMRAERERRRLEDDATDFSSEAPYTSDAFSDASRPPDTDDDSSAPPSSDPNVIEIFDSDDELDDWGLTSEANIVYLVPKGDESEGELNAPSSPSPAGAQLNAPRGRLQQPTPLQLYTPPRSKTASSVAPFDTPNTDERPFIQDSPAYAPPSSPLPPSSPPLSSSPVAPSPIKSRPKLTRPQSSPIRRPQPSPVPTAHAEQVTDNDRTPAASKFNTTNTPQSTPIPRLDLSKMLSTKRKGKKSLSIFNSPATTPSRQSSVATDNSSPERSPTRGSMAPPARASPPLTMSAKAKGKQRAVDLFTPTPPLSQDDSSSIRDSSSLRDSSSPVRGAPMATQPSVTRMSTTSVTRMPTASVTRMPTTSAQTSTPSQQAPTPAQPTVPRAKKRKRQSSAGSAMSVDEQFSAAQPAGGSTSAGGAKSSSDATAKKTPGSSPNKPSDTGKPSKALPAREPTCYVEISVPPPRQTAAHKAQTTKHKPTNPNTQAHEGTQSSSQAGRTQSSSAVRTPSPIKAPSKIPRPRAKSRARSQSKPRPEAEKEKEPENTPPEAHSSLAQAQTPAPQIKPSPPLPRRTKPGPRSRSRPRTCPPEAGTDKLSGAAEKQPGTADKPTKPKRGKSVTRATSTTAVPQNRAESARTPSVLPEPPPYAPPSGASAGAPAQAYTAPNQAYTASTQPYPAPNQAYPYPPPMIDPTQAQFVVGQLMHHLAQLFVGGQGQQPQAGYPPGQQAGYPPGQQPSYPPYPPGAPYAPFPQGSYPYRTTPDGRYASVPPGPTYSNSASSARYASAAPSAAYVQYSADESASATDSDAYRSSTERESHRPTIVARSRSRGRRVSFAGRVVERSGSEATEAEEEDGEDDDGRRALREGIQRDKSTERGHASAVDDSSSSDDEPLGEAPRGRARAATIRAQTPAPPEGRQGRRR